MCGIAGIVSLRDTPVRDLRHRLGVMSSLLVHRGPDDEGIWLSDCGKVGFAHRRLAIIDVSRAGRQPMQSQAGNVITYNGEVYNYLELRRRLSAGRNFRTHTDTEVILAAHEEYGDAFLEDLRGMFALAVWEPGRRQLLCARDRFGIKPFYYAETGDELLFASEIKALLPFLPTIETDGQALAEYLTFQYTIGDTTLFKSVKQLQPGHMLKVAGGTARVSRYWDVHYELDFDHSAHYYNRRLKELLNDSVSMHLRSDVPLGSYLSGGIDSTLVAALASRHDQSNRLAFHGKFTDYPGYDESEHARAASQTCGKELLEVDITAQDFADNIGKVIYYLDHPVAGPGSFPQYMVSGLAASHVKVVLGGQGGDEIFGGYVRYLLAYFEQCINAAIEGTHQGGSFVVTPESIIPNLGVLREYKPLIRRFWESGLFESLDRRYFRLVDRSTDMQEEVDWHSLDQGQVFESFRGIFNSTRNVRHEAYFDSMTHFDFKCLLPALLHVEDRMSMAHGLESRVPLLDHPLVEFAATVPADVKFKGGRMKHLLKTAYGDVIPKSILERRDKMGFPVPLREWFSGELREFVQDLFRSRSAREREFMNTEVILAGLDGMERYSRKIWGLVCLEQWHQIFHDRAAEYRRLAEERARASGGVTVLDGTSPA